MKHLLVINSHAGSKETKEALKANIEASFKNLKYEIYETTAPKSATEYLKKYFSNEDNKKELTRVYACGGDGTINEVVNGIYGFDNVELAILPVGTGNDFVKIYGADNDVIDDYRDLKQLINGKPIEIDLTKVESDILKDPLYSINVVNFGFDAIVGAKGNINKLKGKKDPYGPAAIIPAILGGRYNNIVVKADGKALNKKKLLLSSVSQGQVVGGKYHASPKSDNTDGLMDVVVIKTMSLMRLLIQYFGAYEHGKHLDNPKLMKRIAYARAKNVEIIAPKDIDLCVDGEIIRGSYFKLSCLHKAIKLIPPSKVK